MGELPAELVFGWGNEPERGVQPVVVKPADVFDDGQFEPCARAPDAIGDQLGFERVDPRFGERVRLRLQLHLMVSLGNELSV